MLIKKKLSKINYFSTKYHIINIGTHIHIDTII